MELLLKKMTLALNVPIFVAAHVLGGTANFSYILLKSTIFRQL
jgi:hypothetical protein